MVRRLRRDVVAWFTAVPGSVLMVVCLFLPQARDCHGHVEGSLDTGAAPFMLLVALFGLLPVFWRAPSLRGALGLIVAVIGVFAAVITVIGIPFAIYVLVSRKWLGDEELAALGAIACLLLFILLFPFVALFGDWEVGAFLAWAAAWVEVVGLMVWSSAAGHRRWMTEGSPSA